MNKTIYFFSNVDSEVLSGSLIKNDLINDGIEIHVSRLESWPKTIKKNSIVIIRRIGDEVQFGDLDAILKLCDMKKASLILISGEKVPNYGFEAYSTVERDVVAGVGSYLREGGPENFINAFYYICNQIYKSNFELKEPRSQGNLVRFYSSKKKKPRVGIIFYLAQLVAKNTTYITELVNELEKLDLAPFAYAIYSSKERKDVNRLIRMCKEDAVKALITTIWAPQKEWGESLGDFSSLGIPIIQAITSGSLMSDWSESPLGLNPLDVVTQVVFSEINGRITTVPFCFKTKLSIDEKSEVITYRCKSERTHKVAATTKRLVDLEKMDNADKKIAIVLSAYPSKRSRLGNAVGLDTPKSLVNVLNYLRDDGYCCPGWDKTSDELMLLLADGFLYEEKELDRQAFASSIKYEVSSYLKWFEKLSEETKNKVKATWGNPPGDVICDGESFVFCGLKLDNIYVFIQPPRGYGFNPISIYHSPDLAPTHHYLAFYRFIEERCDALIHLGKHGTLEWLPGKSIGLSKDCFPDMALYSIPLIYPFIVNDPGEGVQAKRRTHAQIIDHLIPPMGRAGMTNELSELEALLDEHANIAAMNPEKLPLARMAIFNKLKEANMLIDLDLQINDPQGEEIDEMIGHIDGYICELKDAPIRTGLHVLGELPERKKLKETIREIVSVDQHSVKSLGASLIKEGQKEKLKPRDKSALIDEQTSQVLDQVMESNFRLKTENETINYIQDVLYPKLLKVTDELDNIVGALSGKFVPPGPAGAPTRGMAHVLPTGRNFYGVDPRVIPTPLAMQVGKELAKASVNRYLARNNEPLRHIAIVVWATQTIRTGGDDIAMALALSGLEPVYDKMSFKVVDLRVIPDSELEFERVNVTLKISGLFRDVFSNVVDLLVKGFTKLKEQNMSNCANAIFGPGPGAYGSGILPLIDSGNWKTSADLAEVFTTYSSHQYLSEGKISFAREEFLKNLADVQAVVKTQDNREHDIFDSDDYMQEHGGMINAVKVIRGENPSAFFADTSRPNNPKIKDLQQEANKVARTRVLNPKWINSMTEHGYKGAFEIAATVDYVFGYQATAGCIDDWIFDAMAESYLLDDEVFSFLLKSNPYSAVHIGERLLEAHERGLWQNANVSLIKGIQERILEAEGDIEDRF